MLTGFALVAWPAEYGVTGASTFIVNQLGTIYQKDLGPDTDRLARAIKDFNPTAPGRRLSNSGASSNAAS